MNPLRLILPLLIASVFALSGCSTPKVEPIRNETLILKVDPVLLESVPPLKRLGNHGEDITP